MKILHLACLIILSCLLIIGSASAGNFTSSTYNDGSTYEYTNTGNEVHFDLSDDGFAIINFEFTVYNRPSTTDFTLTMLDGSTHVGSIVYSNNTFSSGATTLTLDGSSKYWSYGTIFWTDINNLYISTYAKNTDTGDLGILLAEKRHIFSSLTNKYHYVFSPENIITEYPISKVDINSTGSDLYTFIRYQHIEKVKTKITTETDTSILGYATQLYNFVLSTITLVYEIMSVFVTIIMGHYFQIFVLYECVVIAYTCNQYRNRDIVSWFKKFIKYQLAFIYFIFDFINIILEIFSKVVDTLIKWWS
jgi:hypothetical protein